MSPETSGSDDPIVGRCVTCGKALESDGCCSTACAAAAERELKRNVIRLQRRWADPEQRRRVAERNGHLSSALLRWRPAGPSDNTNTTSVPHGRGERILVVDDEPAVLALVRATLESFEYRVATAAHGREALELFDRESDDVDVILVDLMMPVMDGYETIRALRSRDDEVAIIATSGANTPEARERSLSEGATRFLAKPYPAHTLARMLADVVTGQKQLEDR